ncbi:IclR family transcriptional regulator [Arthrobacter crystallopoietes BAB-32]|uniref:IclR family transcriptional regulator n=1 Tax=Arthrobacter crystallopoietes BAB-32 TaxID=1246476 RepID=N1UXC9_9MICC|nr:IclR family transcriptional regulator C-terminal domain-containing protein [Arthrobacter crystallopoietes]EMY32414.1 IclR family transcriptional regulator [Arthrobacter crystallopoietes BAB-32]
MEIESAEGNPAYYVKSVEKTFAVLLAFTADEPRLTMTRVAAKAELSRAAARRFLLTLADLGYLRTDGTHFELTPRALDVGASFLANLTLPQIAEPHLRRLAVDLNETTSLCILDGTDVVYIARVAAPRLLSVSVNVGTRFPAWATSMGRILLAGLPEAHREAYYESVELTSYTENTVASIDALRSEVDRAAERGWSLVSRELDDGLRGLAVPVRRGNDLIAALNVSLQTHRAPEDEIAATVLPRLQLAAEGIADDFGGRQRGVA